MVVSVCVCPVQWSGVHDTREGIGRSLRSSEGRKSVNVQGKQFLWMIDSKQGRGCRRRDGIGKHRRNGR